MLASPQKILLTGGTSGIGLALLHQLHRQGHRVIVLARNIVKLKELHHEIKNLDIYAYDFRNTQQLKICVEKILSEHPDISILINNAAIQLTPRFTDPDFDFDGIELEVNINFLAPAHLSYLMLRSFIVSGKSCAIVNISSGLAFYPKASSAVYCATKAAIHSLSQGLRYQLSGQPIRILEVILPLVDTPMTAGRGRGKLSVGYVAEKIIHGMNSGKEEIYIGKARWLPLLARISPRLTKNILRTG